MTQLEHIIFNIIKFGKLFGLIIISSWSLQLCSLEHKTAQAASSTGDCVRITITDTTHTASTSPKGLLRRAASAPLSLVQTALSAAKNYLTRTPTTKPLDAGTVIISKPKFTAAPQHTAPLKTIATVDTTIDTAVPSPTRTSTLRLTEQSLVHGAYSGSSATFAISPATTDTLTDSFRTKSPDPKEPSLQVSLHEIIKLADSERNPKLLIDFIRRIKYSRNPDLLAQKLRELDHANHSNTLLHTAVLTHSPELITLLGKEYLTQQIDLTKQINRRGETPVQLLSEKEILRAFVQIENRFVGQRYKLVATNSPIPANPVFKYGPEFCTTEIIRIYKRSNSSRHNAACVDQSISAERTALTDMSAASPYLW